MSNLNVALSLIADKDAQLTALRERVAKMEGVGGGG